MHQITSLIHCIYYIVTEKTTTYIFKTDFCFFITHFSVLIIHYTLFAFLEAVDQNCFLWVSQKHLIIEAIFYNRSITCVISFKKMYTFMVLSSVLYEIWIKIVSKLLPWESRTEYSKLLEQYTATPAVTGSISRKKCICVCSQAEPIMKVFLSWFKPLLYICDLWQNSEQVGATSFSWSGNQQHRLFLSNTITQGIPI